MARNDEIPLAHPMLGPGVAIDVRALLGSRLLLQANSGGGKSWAIRRILEQTYGACQHVVIDVEGEFHSLREKYDYVLAAPRGGDCRVDVASAPLLARRLLELNVSAIVDIYELGEERHKFVAAFLGALVDAPRELWHPALVVVDEAQKFCPEQARSASAAAVVALTTLGRKRGFCAVLATQRISELKKSAAAECNSKLIGRCGIQDDRERAAKELGFRQRGPEAESLRSLPPGEFYALGPAFSDSGTIRVQIGLVSTTHPEPGRQAAPPTPPNARIRALLSRIGDLPAEAAEEAATLGTLRAKIEDLEGQLRALRKASAARTPPLPPPSPPRTVIVEKVPDGVSSNVEVFLGKLRDVRAGLDDAVTLADQVLATLHATESTWAPAGPTPSPNPGPPPRALSSRREERPGPRPRSRVDPSNGSPALRAAGVADTTGSALSIAETRILEALAWMESIGQASARNEAIAFLAGYRPGGGAYTAPCGALRRRGLIAYPDRGQMSLTDRGRAIAPRPTLPVDASVTQLQAAVRERLSEPERRILAPLIVLYPNGLDVAALAAVSGYEASGGAFNHARGRLRTLGLVTYPSRGTVRAANLLFPGRGNDAGGKR